MYLFPGWDDRARHWHSGILSVDHKSRAQMVRRRTIGKNRFFPDSNSRGPVAAWDFALLGDA